MGKSAVLAQIQPKILREGQEAPQRRQGAALGKSGDGQVQQHHHQISRDDAQQTLEVELAIIDRLMTRHPAEQLTADQIAAEHEEEVYTRPADIADMLV